MEGYTVITASDGLEGLEKARASHPDAIVLDVMMPKMDGLEVARTLKGDRATKSIPIVLLSAKAQQADLQAGATTGADEYLTKPFDPLELLDRVAALIAQP
jgi:DNA-binding response OmpR family regulator